jgi:hypothetical protein
LTKVIFDKIYKDTSKAGLDYFSGGMWPPECSLEGEMPEHPLIILQVEDTLADAQLTAHAMHAGEIPHSLHVVTDGRQAVVRRQLFLLLDDNYFSRSTTITL